MSTTSELQIKQDRLAEFLDRHKLDGVLLTERPNFSWITCGKLNYIANNATAGVATILATATDRICLANAIESPRFEKEELAGTGIQTVTFPWWDPAAMKRAAALVIDGRRFAADSE